MPVLLGSGVPFFEQLKAAPILLDGPSLVIEGERVAHLRYTIRRPLYQGSAVAQELQ